MDKDRKMIWKFKKLINFITVLKEIPLRILIRLKAFPPRNYLLIRINKKKSLFSRISNLSKKFTI